ncbi:hypothetical protein [Streptomyces cinnamoneus]|uniref:Uncharacterized protein n=1 Tax=Streptomyces cinnamoneus TaxID=53446 RepID=A0A918U3E0_STRCJ|nr:hypothetical protein [Streptomyces cinnamoneus]GHC71629.1 hypothetical protein GCM10010507_58350 [Streptomyces cinnamoneus]
MSVPDVPLGILAVDTFTSGVGLVVESADGLVRLQHPNGFSWQAYATNLRPPEQAEKHRFAAAERVYGPLPVPPGQGD